MVLSALLMPDLYLPQPNCQRLRSVFGNNIASGNSFVRTNGRVFLNRRGVYPSTSNKASSSSSMGANPSKRWWMMPSSLTTNDHSVLGRFHSSTVGDTRARVRSPWISAGLSKKSMWMKFALPLYLSWSSLRTSTCGPHTALCRRRGLP